MRALSEAEFLATMDEPRPVDLSQGVPFDFWPYVDSLPPDVDGYIVEREEVTASSVMRSGHWQHVLLATDMPNVFVVLVLDLREQAVLGHRLLNLNVLYGVEVE